jgi:hypothetical protein
MTISPLWYTLTSFPRYPVSCTEQIGCNLRQEPCWYKKQFVSQSLRQQSRVSNQILRTGRTGLVSIVFGAVGAPCSTQLRSNIFTYMLVTFHTLVRLVIPHTSY